MVVANFEKTQKKHRHHTNKTYGSTIASSGSTIASNDSSVVGRNSTIASSGKYFKYFGCLIIQSLGQRIIRHKPQYWARLIFYFISIGLFGGVIFFGLTKIVK
jgi:effector-binding domain-containing protein